MVKFISTWTGEPIYINPAQVQSVMQRREIFSGKYFWVAGHSTVMFAGWAGEDPPVEHVVGNPDEVALALECAAASVARGSYQ